MHHGRRGGPGSHMNQMQYDLKVLKDGEHIDSKTMEIDPLAKDIPKPKDKTEGFVDSSKTYLKSLDLSYRDKRNLDTDKGNPRQELPKFAKYVDQIQPFDKPPLSMIEPHDGAAKQQFGIVIAGRENYVLEENKFDRQLTDRENSLDPQPQHYESDRRRQLAADGSDYESTRKTQLRLERAHQMESTQSL